MANIRIGLMFLFIISLVAIGVNKTFCQDLDYFEQNNFSIAEIKFKGLDDSNDMQKDERWWLFEKDIDSVFQLLNKHKIKIKRGSPVETEKIKISRKVLKNWLGVKGFQKGKVSVSGEKISDKRIRLVYTVERGEKVVVDSINFVGNKNVPSAELLQVLKNTMKNSWQFWDERKYEYYTWKDVREYLFSKGYFRATVELKSQRNGDLVNITINVNEGIIYRVGEIEIVGLSVFSEKQFLEMFGQKQGDIANGKLIKDFLYDKVNTAYKNKGYLQYDAEFDPEYINPKAEGQNGIINLKILIDEGKQFKLSKITIISAENAKPRLKKLLGLNEGEIFNQSRFEAGIKRINDTKDFLFVDKDKDVEIRTDEEIPEIYLVVKVKSKWMKNLL